MGKHNLGHFRIAAVCACGDHGFVGLTFGMVTFFDAECAERVGRFNWSVLTGCGAPYVRTRSKGKTLLLHRMLSDAPDADVVDHVSGDTMNNRSANLRVCAQSENAKNRTSVHGESRFKGVHKVNGKWAFQVYSCGNRYRGRGYPTEDEAARAYDAAALEMHGDFSRTNASLGLFDGSPK